MELSNFQLEKLLGEVAELGALIALVKAGNIKPYIKKSEAFRKYGRKEVEQWIDKGFITPRKDGDQSAPWRIDRIEIETIRKSQILFQFL